MRPRTVLNTWKKPEAIGLTAFATFCNCLSFFGLFATIFKFKHVGPVFVMAGFCIIGLYLA